MSLNLYIKKNYSLNSFYMSDVGLGNANVAESKTDKNLSGN